MNSVDALVLGMLAMMDLAFIAYLRWRRSLAVRNERVMRSLTLAVRRENAGIVMPAWRWLAKAS